MRTPSHAGGPTWERAVEHGALSSLSIPLLITDGMAGAVNVVLSC